MCCLAKEKVVTNGNSLPLVFQYVYCDGNVNSLYTLTPIVCSLIKSSAVIVKVVILENMSFFL